MILVREEESIRAERKKNRMLTAYIAVACVYAAVALMLLFLSPDHYTLWLIGDILLTVAFGSGSIYFFTITYDGALKRSKLLGKISSALEEKEYGIFLSEEEKMTVDGVEMRILLFNVRGTERELHVYESDLSLESGVKYYLVLRGGVITEIANVDE